MEKNKRIKNRLSINFPVNDLGSTRDGQALDLLTEIDNMKTATNPKPPSSDSEKLLLSHTDLAALTGCKRVESMIEWLKARGWVFEQPNKRGQVPCVSRLYFLQRMGVSFNVTPHSVIAQKVQQKPNLDFLRVKK